MLVRAVLESYLGIYAAIAPTRPLGDRTGIACRKGYAVSQQTTFETSQTDTHGVGSARSLRLKSSSQMKPSQYCDTALIRHTFRNEFTEANFWGPHPILRKRVRSASHFNRRVAQLRAQTSTSSWHQHAWGLNEPAPSGIAVVVAREIPEQPCSSRIRHEDEKTGPPFR